jgi:hypothetical protein
LLVREQLSKRDQEIIRIGAQLELARAKVFGMERSKSPIKGQSENNIAGIIDMNTANDRIRQLEIQIEYLQEHIDSLEKELAALEQGHSAVHSGIIKERDQMARDLESERVKSKELLKNLQKLEQLVSDLNQIKDPLLKPSKPNPNSLKNSRHIAELGEKLKATQLKLETNNKRIAMYQKDIQSFLI